MVRNIFVGRPWTGKLITPADAVSTTFFEPWDQVGAPCLRFRLSAIPNGIQADMHTAKTKRLPVLRCWLKKRMSITHIAGE